MLVREFAFICGVICPGLKVVSIRHSPYTAGDIIEPYEDEREIDSNDRVSTLRLEGFDCEMDQMMGQFSKYFPILTELHLVHWDGSAIQEIFQW